MKTLICLTSLLLLICTSVCAEEKLTDRLKVPTLSRERTTTKRGNTLVYKDWKLSKIYYQRRPGYNTTTGYDYETNEFIMIVHPYEDRD